jgi:hypothetical protein
MALLNLMATDEFFTQRQLRNWKENWTSSYDIFALSSRMVGSGWPLPA